MFGIDFDDIRSSGIQNVYDLIRYAIAYMAMSAADGLGSSRELVIQKVAQGCNAQRTQRS